ncbi:unnamed protein product, partial [Staurois parvus]
KNSPRLLLNSSDCLLSKKGSVLTFGGYLYRPDIWGDICTVLTFGGYLYRPDIWGDICTVLTFGGISVPS